jgi:hypothetical protein
LVQVHHERDHTTKVFEDSGGAAPQTLKLGSFLNGQLSEEKTGVQEVGVYMVKKKIFHNMTANDEHLINYGRPVTCGRSLRHIQYL